MPSDINVNKAWRNLWTTQVKVDGVWRIADVYSKVDGEWKITYKYRLEEEDFVGFRLIYQFDYTATYPTLPHLVPNKNILATFNVTGEDPGMNFLQKGVLLSYDANRWYDSTEGIFLYKGILYGLLTNGDVVAISLSSDYLLEDERINMVSNDNEDGFISNRVNHLNVTLQGYTVVSGEKKLIGWNGFFRKEQHLELGTHDLTWSLEKTPKVILPCNKREELYDGKAKIGIARNLTTPTDNMLGSWGAIDQTILAVKINGNLKPFSVEIVE